MAKSKSLSLTSQTISFPGAEISNFIQNESEPYTSQMFENDVDFQDWDESFRQSQNGKTWQEQAELLETKFRRTRITMDTEEDLQRRQKLMATSIEVAVGLLRRQEAFRKWKERLDKMQNFVDEKLIAPIRHGIEHEEEESDDSNDNYVDASEVMDDDYMNDGMNMPNGHGVEDNANGFNEARLSDMLRELELKSPVMASDFNREFVRYPSYQSTPRNPSNINGNAVPLRSALRKPENQAIQTPDDAMRRSVRWQENLATMYS